MAIDRQVIWVIRRHTGYPNIHPGYSFASAAEKAAMIAANCAQDIKQVPARYLAHITRQAPYTPS